MHPELPPLDENDILCAFVITFDVSVTPEERAKVTKHWEEMVRYEAVDSMRKFILNLEKLRDVRR